jgi:hypothetical protein
MTDMTDWRKLFVESPNDKHVILHLLRCHGLLQPDKEPSTFAVKPLHGDANILKRLRLEVKKQDEEGLERIGVIIDADADLAKRWRDIQTILAGGGYTNLPERPAPEGTIIEQESRPTVGIWIMPDNEIPGNLETFVSLLVPAGDVLWPHAADVIQQLPDRRFADKDTGKAHVHTWLAWQQSPGTPMGWAITRKFLDPTAPHAHTLLAWLRRLFTLPPTSSTHESPTQAPGGPAQ